LSEKIVNLLFLLKLKAQPQRQKWILKVSIFQRYPTAFSIVILRESQMLAVGFLNFFKSP